MSAAGLRLALQWHCFGFRYRCAPDYKPGRTGAGCFGAVWRQDALDLVCPGDRMLAAVANLAGKARDVSVGGNEIGLCAARQIATLVEDLNMDGYADLYPESPIYSSELPAPLSRISQCAVKRHRSPAG